MREARTITKLYERTNRPRPLGLPSLATHISGGFVDPHTDEPRMAEQSVDERDLEGDTGSELAARQDAERTHHAIAWACWPTDYRLDVTACMSLREVQHID
jgi:hypothetical protein